MIYVSLIRTLAKLGCCTAYFARSARGNLYTDDDGHTRRSKPYSFRFLQKPNAIKVRVYIRIDTERDKPARHIVSGNRIKIQVRLFVEPLTQVVINGTFMQITRALFVVDEHLRLLDDS